MSAHAILFWGIPFDKQDEVPWPVDEPGDAYYDLWEERFRRCTDSEPPEPACDVRAYGRSSFSFFFAAITESIAVADVGKPASVEFPDVPAEWRASLKTLCDGLGAPFSEPAWHIAAFMEN